jgi:multidrug efflux pump subunit AcrA (membrane-fusion protein)
MSMARTVLGWVTPLLILAAGIAVFLSLGSQPPPQRKEAVAPAALPVSTVEVEPVREGLTIGADGVVVPLREVTLAAEVAGRVRTKSAACNEGQVVEAGTVLFEIDPRDYELDVARLERELKQADLAIEELDEETVQNSESIALAQRQVELARREVARLGNLKSDRIVTESEHDRALRDELTAANSLTTLEGQKRVLVKRRHRLLEARQLASTMLEKAKLDLARTTIRAPIAGIVVEDKVEQDSFVTKGTPLVTIEDTSSAEVRTSLEMEDVARIWGRRNAGAGPGAATLDAPAEVIFRIGDAAYAWDGVLSRQEGRGLDEKTRTLPCRVRVADPRAVQSLDRYGAKVSRLPAGAPQSLLRGMFVEVHVHVDSPAELVSIPVEAQRPSGDVWVMREGRLVVLRPKAVQAVDGRLVFEAEQSGLVAGDRVVISQISSPRQGMAVAETPPAAEAAARPEDKDAT